MTVSNNCSQAFIVRIWCEPREIEGALPEWRGMIEHVASGSQLYFTDLDEIAIVIRPYLELMGVKIRLSEPKTGQSTSG
jgi:hypothetical protein